jgi:hypothetical protein
MVIFVLAWGGFHTTIYTLSLKFTLYTHFSPNLTSCICTLRPTYCIFSQIWVRFKLCSVHPNFMKSTPGQTFFGVFERHLLVGPFKILTLLNHLKNQTCIYTFLLISHIQTGVWIGAVDSIFSFVSFFSSVLFFSLSSGSNSIWKQNQTIGFV